LWVARQPSRCSIAGNRKRPTVGHSPGGFPARQSRGRQLGLAAALGVALHPGLEPRATVVERLRAYGAFEDCTAGDQRTILGQVCMVIVHLTVEERGRRLYRVHWCSGRREALREDARHAHTPVSGCRRCRVGLCHHVGRAFLAGGGPTQCDGYCEGVNGALLEVFATDTRRQALATCERHAH
ncbi:MAG: hypothetical protein M3361_21225, partial [Candidatus Tectomicrobia bacterium]|nr:hypothetical protein [Candidatus Tectomicrobia bacterium]